MGRICNAHEYVDKFKELRALLLMKNSLLPKEHFLDSFIYGGD